MQTVHKYVLQANFFLLIMGGIKHNVRILNPTMSHIFRESTFDGLILNVFNSGMRIVEHNFGHSITYMIK